MSVVHKPTPTDFLQDILCLQSQYNQLDTWKTLINEQLQTSTSETNYELYKTLYLLDTFQTDKKKLQNIIQARIQIHETKFQLEEKRTNSDTYTQPPSHLIARPSVIEQLRAKTTTTTTAIAEIQDFSNSNYYTILTLPEQ